MRSRNQDHLGQHGETPSLLKIQKLAGYGGACLESQLLGRLWQENCLNPRGRGCGELRSCHCTPAWVTRVKLYLKKKKKKAATQRILINKALTPQDRAPGEKKEVYEFCCSRLKHTCLAALNEQQSSQLSTWAPVKNRLSPQAACWPLYIQRVTSQRTDQTVIRQASSWDKESRKRNW